MYFGVIYVAAVAIDAGYRTASRYPWSDVIQITRGLARPTGKAKGVRRSEVKSQPTSSLMHLCISGDRNDIGPSLLFIFRSPCWSSRPLPCSIEKSRPSLPTTRCDATSVHRPQCRARFLVSPPPLLKLALFDIFTDEHARPVVQIFLRPSIYIAYSVVRSPRFPEIFHEIDRCVDRDTVDRRIVPFHL